MSSNKVYEVLWQPATWDWNSRLPSIVKTVWHVGHCCSLGGRWRPPITSATGWLGGGGDRVVCDCVCGRCCCFLSVWQVLVSCGWPTVICEESGVRLYVLVDSPLRWVPLASTNGCMRKYLICYCSWSVCMHMCSWIHKSTNKLLKIQWNLECPHQWGVTDFKGWKFILLVSLFQYTKTEFPCAKTNSTVPTL